MNEYIITTPNVKEKGAYFYPSALTILNESVVKIILRKTLKKRVFRIMRTCLSLKYPEGVIYLNPGQVPKGRRPGQ